MKVRVCWRGGPFAFLLRAALPVPPTSRPCPSRALPPHGDPRALVVFQGPGPCLRKAKGGGVSPSKSRHRHPQGAHRALCLRCAKSRRLSTAGSHGSQGPELRTPDAVLTGSCSASVGGRFAGGVPGMNTVIMGAVPALCENAPALVRQCGRESLQRGGGGSGYPPPPQHSGPDPTGKAFPSPNTSP